MIQVTKRRKLGWENLEHVRRFPFFLLLLLMYKQREYAADRSWGLFSLKINQFGWSEIYRFDRFSIERKEKKANVVIFALRLRPKKETKFDEYRIFSASKNRPKVIFDHIVCPCLSTELEEHGRSTSRWTDSPSTHSRSACFALWLSVIELSSEAWPSNETNIHIPSNILTTPIKERRALALHFNSFTFNDNDGRQQSDEEKRQTRREKRWKFLSSRRAFDSRQSSWLDRRYQRKNASQISRQRPEKIEKAWGWQKITQFTSNNGSKICRSQTARFRWGRRLRQAHASVFSQ